MSGSNTDVFLWRVFDEYNGRMIATYRRDTCGDRFELRRGALTPIDFPKLIFDVEVSMSDLRSLDDICNTTGVPLVSSRVANVLRELCGDDLQLLDASIECIDGRIDDYKVVVATSVASCLDLKKSEYSKIPGTQVPMTFFRRSVKQGCLGGKMLARDEASKSHLFVSSELVESFRQHEFEVCFVAPEEDSR